MQSVTVIHVEVISNITPCLFFLIQCQKYTLCIKDLWRAENVVLKGRCFLNLFYVGTSVAPLVLYLLFSAMIRKALAYFA